MPVKRRVAKRRQDSTAELDAWSETFTSGFDFFGDLAPFGLVDDRNIQAAAKEAWTRLGVAFLGDWRPTDVRETPWALQEFGEP
ncbi:hypothetical protein LRP31_18800 [Mesorhizobium mediterraneum]|uniref:Uncharacterized protein n=1 Tax=Mesorhizobium mediterraneum TaxID=43617 RepID=A0AB36RB52_9HYPH|nr:hypothetical protein [Mesorhizobium mediterraneum]PAQ01560.1 hypothetical protein CIT25_16115 [Mesorhizobium mediterraneum]WIW51143.1 hypothetical protein LRP31_18800 [Mesorhizobium mediterraneum]